jgi:ABC-type nitrate/sulfonate/bicarbonate transport system permease component
MRTTTDLQTIDATLLARHRRDRRRQRLLQVALPLAVGVVFALAWQLWALARGVEILPTFTQAATSVASLLGDHALWRALAISDLSMVIGFAVSAAIAIPLGLAMGRLRQVESVMDVYVNIILVAPMVILMPIVLMALGLTLRARVAVIVLFAAPFILVPVRSGMRLISHEVVDMCRSFGATEGQLWRNVFLPGTLPSMMTGLRQGFAHGMTGMLVVELTLLAAGIGDLLLDLQSRLQFDRIFALVFLIVCQALLGIGALQWLERRLRAGGGAR